MRAVARVIGGGSAGGEELAEARAAVLEVAPERAEPEAEGAVREPRHAALGRAEGAALDPRGLSVGEAFEHGRRRELVDLEGGPPSLERPRGALRAPRLDALGLEQHGEKPC